MAVSRRRPTLRAGGLLRPGSLVPLGLVAVVTALSVAAAAGAFEPETVAASYARVMQHGEVWSLVTSALVADEPVWVSLLAFAVITLAALAVCGTRLFWIAAIVGHIGSAVLVYSFMAVARAIDHGIYAASVGALDFGVSTIQGGLVGASAAVLWRRTRGSAPRRALLVAGLVCLAVIGWTLHPDPSVLTYEHLVAFALGIVAARVEAPPSLPRGARPSPR